jgi:hypothetical protein
MCTAVAEAAPEWQAESGYTLKNPKVQTFLTFAGTTYLMSFYQIRNEKKYLAKKAELEAAKASAAPEVVVEAVVDAAVPEAALEAAPVGLSVVKTAGSVADWKVADVTAWLSENELGVHAEAFKTHSVNGKMLLILDEQDLYKVLNVVSPLHRKKLMLAISELRKSYLNP